MNTFLKNLRQGLLFRIEVLALFVGALVIGLCSIDFLKWLGLSERASFGLGIIVWVFLFWMAAIYWIYIYFKRDLQPSNQNTRNETKSEK